MRVIQRHDDTTIPRHNNTNIMNCEQQEWTDRYLFGELEGEERRRFEAKFATDQAFRADVELQAEIMVGINSYAAAEPKVFCLATVQVSAQPEDGQAWRQPHRPWHVGPRHRVRFPPGQRREWRDLLKMTC